MGLSAGARRGEKGVSGEKQEYLGAALSRLLTMGHYNSPGLKELKVGLSEPRIGVSDVMRLESMRREGLRKNSQGHIDREAI